MGDIDGRTDRSNTREHMSQSGSRASFKSGKAFPNSHGLTRMFTDVSAVGDRRYRRRNLRKRGTEGMEPRGCERHRREGRNAPLFPLHSSLVTCHFFRTLRF
jgi:hypothetical protein